MPNILETFVATESLGPVNYIFPTFHESFVKTASIPVVKVGVTATDSFTATDSTTSRNYVLASEQFFAQDSTIENAKYRVTVLETFRARDAAQAGDRVNHTVTDSFVALAGEAASLQRAWHSEQFLAGDNLLTITSASSVQVLETFRASDTAHPHHRHTVTETFVAGDSYEIGGTNRLTVTETFVAEAAAHPRRNDYARVTETFVATDTTTATAQIQLRVSELFRAADFVHTQDDLASQLQFDTADIPLTATSAWTADMYTWGMSRYIGLPVAEFDMVQYGVGPTGVFRPVEQPVLSFVETGDMSLDDPESQRRTLERKRLNYVYTHSAHPQELNVLVTADHNGDRLTSEYTQDSRASTDTRAVRCTVGRGYASNYIKLRVGGERIFDMASLEVETTVTQRRI